MKRSLIIGLLGVGCIATSSFGQGTFKLDNYNSSGPIVTYGTPGIAADGVSGTQGIVGSGLRAGWTFGFYYAVGNVTVGPYPSGNFGDPSTFGGGLTLATGPGSTAPFYTSTFAFSGTAESGSTFAVPGTSANGGDGYFDGGGLQYLIRQLCRCALEGTFRIVHNAHLREYFACAALDGNLHARLFNSNNSRAIYLCTGWVSRCRTHFLPPPKMNFQDAMRQPAVWR